MKIGVVYLELDTVILSRGKIGRSLGAGGARMSFVYLTDDGLLVRKSGGRFIVGRNEEELFSLPVEDIEGIVLMGRIQVTSAVMTECLKRDIPLTWLSHEGIFFGRLESVKQSNAERYYRQVIAMEEGTFTRAMAKKIIEAKVHNQLTVLRRYYRTEKREAVADAFRQIMAIQKGLHRDLTTEQIMGYEGIISRFYFQALGKIVPEEFRFEKRSRRPPLDAVNSMLSFGYTLLMYEVYTAISNCGLYPGFGFLHTLRKDHPALASDLMEEWRAPIIDSMVLSLISHHEIREEHFWRSEERPGVFLTNDGRKIFLRAYEKKMRTMNQYREGKMSYRQTVQSQVRSYASALMNDEADKYEPLWIR